MRSYLIVKAILAMYVNNVYIDADKLNTFFTSVFNQVPKINKNLPYSVPHKSFVPNSIFLSPETFNKVINTHSFIEFTCNWFQWHTPRLIKTNS